MQIINLTPHDINLSSGEIYPRSGTLARVDMPYGDVSGLPKEEEGKGYIVSVLVAERLPGRKDLLVPGAQVRDEKGRIVGCESLIAPHDASPALAEQAYYAGAHWVRQMVRMGAVSIEIEQIGRGASGYANAYSANLTLLGTARFMDPYEWDPSLLYIPEYDHIVKTAEENGLTISFAVNEVLGPDPVLGKWYPVRTRQDAGKFQGKRVVFALGAPGNVHNLVPRKCERVLPKYADGWRMVDSEGEICYGRPEDTQLILVYVCVVEN